VFGGKFLRCLCCLRAGKGKGLCGVLAQQESAESGVDTSANHRGAGHDDIGEQRRGGEYGCGDHGHTSPGNGNRPLVVGPVWAGAGYLHRENKRKRKENGVGLGKENRWAMLEK
jgi:hypothetical protein